MNEISKVKEEELRKSRESYNKLVIEAQQYVQSQINQKDQFFFKEFSKRNKLIGKYNGQDTYEGPLGGIFQFSDGGSKVYVTKS